MKYIHPIAIFEKLCAHLGVVGIWLHYLRLYYILRHDRLHVRHPRNISEFNIKEILSEDFNRMAAKYADKYGVRRYVESKGLGDILLDCYGVWDSPDDIDWDSLPDRFALKVNNGCGGHVFCRDKATLDKKSAVERLRKSMSLTEIGFAFEPHYRMIPPKVYAEELMDFPSQADIVDYKFFCVRGEIDSLLIVFDRINGAHKLELYDENWNPIEGLTSEFDHEPKFKKLANVDRMKEVVKILCADFDFVRVDLYEYKGKVYFGELTFTPQGGQFAHFTDKYIKRVYEHMVKVTR